MTHDDKEINVTVTPQDMEFRARAKAAGLPDTLISMYGSALRRLVNDERKPLTEGHISALLMQAAEQRLGALAFARAVEAAHGIGKAAP